MRSDKDQRRRFKEEKERQEDREQDHDGRYLDDGRQHFSLRRKSAHKEDSDGSQFHQGNENTAY